MDDFLQKYNGDDAIAGLPRSEVRAHVLIHRKTWPLVSAEPDNRRRPAAEKGHNRDGFPVYDCDMDDADKSVHAGDAGLNHAVDKDVSASHT